MLAGRPVALCAAVIAAALLLPAHARAHGDPAGEWLLAHPAFFPPDAGISSSDQKALSSLLRSASARGYPLRVAALATRYDLGAQSELFDRPDDYALDLSKDLRVLYQGRMLVVMPSGYAIARDGRADPAEQRVVAALPRAKPFQGAPLAAAIEQAVRKLAAGTGIVLPSATVSSGSGGSETRDRILIAVGAVGLLSLGRVLSLWRRRGRSAPGRAR